MSYSEKILSFAAIIDYMEIHGKATANELMDRLAAHELPNSPATFERLKKDLLSFGFELEYRDLRYMLVKHFSPGQATLFHLVKLAGETMFLKKMIESQAPSDKVLFEVDRQPQFYKLLTPIYQAIDEKRSIKFDYEHYRYGKLTNLGLDPYLLKEFKSRWYVYGYSAYSEEVRTFALDRISNLEIQSNSFVFDDYERLSEKISESFGLNYSEEPTILRIKAYDPQNKYLSTLPLHHSQKSIETTDEYTVFEYYLRPNYELEQELLRISDQVSVLKPDWIKKSISHRLQRALENQKQ